MISKHILVTGILNMYRIYIYMYIYEAFYAIFIVSQSIVYSS